MPPLVAADAGRLPIADDRVDMIFSNLMLHWHPEPHTLFPEWKRVLRIDGLLLFSCFGPDTLRELRAACRLTLPDARPMPFIDMHDFGDMMVASGLADPVMDAEVLRACSAAGVPVTARGSGSGLSGAGIPVEGGIVVSFERMREILEIDADNQLAVVQPGVLSFG